MSNIDLTQYGITGAKVIHNPSWTSSSSTKPTLL